MTDMLIDVILIGLVCFVIVQNLTLNDKLKEIQQRLGQPTP